MDAINEIQSFLRFGSVLGLERMNKLLGKLGNPEKSLQVIHVAGTNGKGSVCRYIYETLRAEGYKAGLFTSPFLEVFHERIEFDGKYISDEDLNRCTDVVLAKVKEMTEEGQESPTEFEVVTAIAFVYFQEKNTDFVVLEVGLGGRGDSTNVVESPLVSIISSISLDHTDRLGHTIPEIASEKAGIIKERVPVIIGTDREDAIKVIEERAKTLDAPAYRARNIKYDVICESLEGCQFKTEIMNKEFCIEISMIGKHQIENAITALYAIEVMRKNGSLVINDQSIQLGFKKAKQIGRFEIMSKNPYVIIDGAHNPDGTRVLKETVLKHFKGKRILITMGILADKEPALIDNMLEISKNFVITEPDSPRKMKAAELAEIIWNKGGNCKVFEKPEEAVAYSKSKSKDYDLLLFSGSLYLIGKIRGLLK